MKLVRYYGQGGVRVGVIDGEEVVDVAATLSMKRTVSAVESAMLADMVALIEGGPRAVDLAAEALAASSLRPAGRQPLSSVRLLAPLIPGLILASGGNYKDHRD